MRSRFRVWFSLLLLSLVATSLPAQQTTPPQPAAADNAAVDNAAATDPGADETGSGALIEQRLATDGELTLVSLVIRGGRMMIPLAVMSVLVVALTFERLLALRKSRIIPRGLVRDLERMRSVDRGLDPREAYRACTRYPSSLSNAVKTMLLRVGRPQSEVEHAVAEACEREADRLYSNVRWIALMGSVAPLIGLMGTVWGIIWTFYKTTQLDVGADRADQLAGGIFVALVTTLGGLTIAIPAMIFAQFFESRIIKLFHEMDEILFNLIPGIEQYEGKMRAQHRKYAEPGSKPLDAPPTTPGAETMPPPMETSRPTA